MAAPPSDSRTLLRSANENAHYLIQLADTKASYLMAASAILAGLLAQQANYGCSDLARDTVFAAIGLALAGAATALLVLIPRSGSQSPGNLLDYDAIGAFETHEDYYARVHTMSPEETDRALAHHVWGDARTQIRKFFWLRWAFRLFGVCLVATLVGVVWVHLPCG